MKNTFGTSVSVTLFGESHGDKIGVVIDGLAPGIEIDESYINLKLSQRRPYGPMSTKRVEKDEYEIVSGVFEGKTTGTPVCILIPNCDTKSGDYLATRYLPRPSHADYTANEKYHGFEDYRGGGHFSGRITAPLVAAGAIAMTALLKKGIKIGTHIKRCASVSDRDFSDYDDDIKFLSDCHFPVLDDEASQKMQSAIELAAKDGDSVGGILETVITGVDAGIGEPWFDSFESQISHILFSVPAIKGVQFGLGFDFADKRGSEVNDAFMMKDGKIVTSTNNNGGINGGITNGMPIVFSSVIKPTPSIYKTQNTVDMKTLQDATITLSGRHDPAIIHRARVVVDSVCALSLCDMLCMRYGTDWLKG